MVNNAKQKCVFHQCELRKTYKYGFCLECEKFPCEKLKRLDKKHKEHDGLSMIENQIYIKNKGVRSFLKAETEKWKCTECGGLVCVGAHEILCSDCGHIVRWLGLITKKGEKWKRN